MIYLYIGQLYGWGDNMFGQLGVGSNIDVSVSDEQANRFKTPVLLNYFTKRKINVVGVAVGRWHSLCYTSLGHVYAWYISIKIYVHVFNY